jgi:hypothetical protein
MHWTQRPENKEKLHKMHMKANKTIAKAKKTDKLIAAKKKHAIAVKPKNDAREMLMRALKNGRNVYEIIGRILLDG